MITLRRALALTAGLLACAGLTLTAPLAASAHTPSVSASCSTLTVNLLYYATTAGAPTPNSVTVSVDGVAVAAAPFGASWAGSFPLGDQTTPHNWSVVIDAVDNFDATFSGTSTPCVPPPPVVPQDASAAVVVVAATCLSGEILTLGPISNAAWGAVTGAYEVTATATSGHLFDDGMPTRTFTGVLAGPLPASAAECAPPPDVATKVTEQADCDTTMVTVTTTTTTTSWVYDQSTASWVRGEPVVTVTTSERPATEEECVVPPARPTPPDQGPVVTPPVVTPPVVTPPVVTPPVVTPPVVTPPVVTPPVVTPPAETPQVVPTPPTARPILTPDYQLPTLAEQSVFEQSRQAVGSVFQIESPDRLAHSGTDPMLVVLAAAGLLGAGLEFRRRALRPVG